MVNSDFAGYTQYSDELLTILDTILDTIDTTTKTNIEAVWAEQAFFQQVRSMITLNFGDFGSTKAQAQEAVALWERIGKTVFAANARLVLATAEPTVPPHGMKAAPN